MIDASQNDQPCSVVRLYSKHFGDDDCQDGPSRHKCAHCCTPQLRYEWPHVILARRATSDAVLPRTTIRTQDALLYRTTRSDRRVLSRRVQGEHVANPVAVGLRVELLDPVRVYDILTQEPIGV
jgi:hypothetical protein